MELKLMINKMRLSIPDSDQQTYLNYFSSYSKSSTDYNMLLVHLLQHLEPFFLMEN